MKYSFGGSYFIFLLFFVNTSALWAQRPDTGNTKQQIIKLNVPALVFKNFSFQYERKVSHTNTFAVAVRYRPTGKIPFKSIVEEAVNDTEIQVDSFRIGNFGITPEFRFYLGKKGAFRGFYIAPFISYNHYRGDVPVNYYDYVNNATIDKTATFTGSVNSFTAGFQLGAQWKLSEKIYLDWWIMGPNYGISKGDFVFSGALNDIEQISLQFELEKIEQTIPLVKIETPEKPNANGAAFKVNGPWAGIRAFGINLGYRF